MPTYQKVFRLQRIVSEERLSALIADQLRTLSPLTSGQLGARLLLDQPMVQQQTILRELNIKLGTARKYLKLANERLSKATLHLQQVDNGTYQAPLFDREGEAMAQRRSIATGKLTHGPKGPVPS